ncbi:hypothetical protein [Flavobacterium taihuense]|uniref:Uncharacterized protein n=1 Tax=Flavobacterium taihuense TaxID=2857508 RepID=A0ABS6Y106_9FLAO|nr:hypothetical protein [Flavobacterium taihuense]MBW4362609.1 hypothetical protein [Flavobacterium taihuense]
MKTKFGVKQLKNTTPLWALWMFRITFLVTKIVVGYIAATNLLSPHAKYEVTLFLTLVVDPFAFGLSKMFGIPNIDK